MGGTTAAEPELGDVVKEFRKAFGQLGSEFKLAFKKYQDEAQYRFDKELGKQLSKHPELYADLKRGVRQFRRGFDKATKDWGLR